MNNRSKKFVVFSEKMRICLMHQKNVKLPKLPTKQQFPGKKTTKFRNSRNTYQQNVTWNFDLENMFTHFGQFRKWLGLNTQRTPKWQGNFTISWFWLNFENGWCLYLSDTQIFEHFVVQVNNSWLFWLQNTKPE